MCQQEGGSVLSFFLFHSYPVPNKPYGFCGRKASWRRSHFRRKGSWDWLAQAGRDIRVDTPVLSHSVPGQDMPAVAAGTGQPTWQRVAHWTPCAAIIIRLGSGTSRAHLSVDPTVHRPAKPPPPKQRLGVRGEKSDPYRCQPTARVAKRRPGPHWRR